MKKKVWLIVSAIFLLAILAVGGIGLSYYLDSRNNAYTMDVSMGPTEKTLVEEDVLSYALINNGYAPVQIREIVVVSTYDENGAPVPAEGSAYAASLARVEELEHAGRKAVQDHQIVYVTEYAVEAGKVPFEKYFQPRKETENIHSAAYTLQYTDCSLQVDVILQGKCREEDDWQTLTGCSDTVGMDAYQPVVPDLTHTVSYSWSIVDGTAYLQGLGTIPEREIWIPARVQLSATERGYVHDPLNGTEYPVMVGDQSLSNTDVREVTFADGVQITDHTMGTFERGFFENCKELIAVHNIPETVTTMVGTFKGCGALQQTPVIPDSVTTMKYTFQNCTALTEISELPDSVTVMDGCFEGCTALQKVPELPGGVVSVKNVFKNCTNLTEVSVMPEGVTDMEGAFMGCTALTKTPALPNSVTNMARCFYGCSALTDVINISASVEDMTSCFANCVSLQALPDFLDHPAEYYGCFSGCTALTGDVEIPTGIMNHERYYTNLKNMFDGCVNIKSVVVQGCKNQDIIAVLPEKIPITFTVEHINKGVCPVCHYVTDTYEVDGLTVYMEHISERMVSKILQHLDNEVPGILKDTCVRLTFTNNFEKYDRRPAAGVAINPTRLAYIRMDAYSKWEATNGKLFWASAGPMDLVKIYEDWLMDSQVKHVTLHELAHCYDFYFDISTSTEWRQLCEKEALGVSKEFDLSCQYTMEDAPREVFAAYVADYVKGIHPFGGVGMKAYVKEIFDEAS